MNARLLDGKILAAQLKDSLKKEVERLKASTGKVPRLINLMIGSDSGACAYANSQKRVAEQIGLRYELRNLPQDVSQKDLITVIKNLSGDPDVNGIMIHKPVPSQINYFEAANTIEISKDLEGINIANIGKMLLGETKIIPCTPAAVMEHLASAKIDLRGKEAVVVGHSDIVGKPLSLLLLRQYATVTVCHIATSEAGHLIEHIGRADVLIVAVGKAKLVKGEWVKKGAVVIDVGINQVGERIVGDVDFDSAAERASYITPVPGGVGPVTVVMLMKNGIEAYKIQKGIK